MTEERNRLFELVSRHAAGADFAPEFRTWLLENMHVWEAFVAEALKVRGRGQLCYSARTIVEVLRHHSLISEVGGPWKIDNDRVPDMARLWALRYPSMAAMFCFRKRPPALGYSLQRQHRQVSPHAAHGVDYGLAVDA